MNPLMPNQDQMTFIYSHYPEYAANPLDILFWLYDMALFNENQAMMQKQAMDVDGAYGQRPNIGGRKANVKGGKKKRGDSSEEEEEDTVYSIKANVKKPKPQPKP
jgi:hypothetical protein